MRNSVKILIDKGFIAKDESVKSLSKRYLQKLESDENNQGYLLVQKLLADKKGVLSEHLFGSSQVLIHLL